MKNAIANVRKNGLEIMRGDEVVSRIEVDKSLLDAMDQILADTEKQIDDAEKTSVNRTIDAFIKEVRAGLYPEEAPGAGDVNLEKSVNVLVFKSSRAKMTSVSMRDFKSSRDEIMKAFDDFAKGKINDGKFYDEIARNQREFHKGDRFSERTLRACGYKDNAAAGIIKTMWGLGIITSQFAELVKNAQKQSALATSDVRRIMLGEVGLSNVVEASVRGFKPDDIDPATDESAVVDSEPLGAGQAGKTYLLTTKTGAKLVFKPELDSRIGLSNLALGSGNAYEAAQKTVNLNFATQDTAKAFGCEDLVVKYSVGSHDGQFGVFMEKAKGFTGEDFGKRKKTKGDGIVPAELFTIQGDKMRANIQGQIAQKLNKLQWLDLITGQGDRHWNNYFVCIKKNVTTNTFDVTVKAIDNDASFTARQVGLQKYALDKNKAKSFVVELKGVCKKLFGKEGWKREYQRVSKDPSLVPNTDGTMTVNLADAKTPEIKMAAIPVLGLQSIAIPEEIDEDFYNKLMEMDKDPSKKQAYLNSLAPRISEEALRATELRLNEAIKYAKKLVDKGKVFGNDDWKDKVRLSEMPRIADGVRIRNSDGKTGVAYGNMGDFVVRYLINSCPSYYKRDNLQYMFS